MPVALRKESVDRNPPTCIIKPMPLMSLSARRAWIEIAVQELIPLADPSLSARRAWIEMLCRFCRFSGRKMSLSARRAWIEMTVVATLATLVTVALRKESVDRNAEPRILFLNMLCRSPQGERG